MSKRVNIPALLLCVMMLLFALARLDVFLGVFRHDIVKQWLQSSREPWTGIVRVWHVTDWLPGRGSGESWLSAVGRSFEKKYRGVFIEVTSMTADGARQRMDKGEKPDVLSFPAGWCDPKWLGKIEPPALGGVEEGSMLRYVDEAGRHGNTLKALPIMRSAYVLLVNIDMAGEREVRLTQDWDMQWLQKSAEQLTFESGRGRQSMHVNGLSMTQNRYGITEAALLSRPDFLPVSAAGNETDFVTGKAAMCLGTVRTLYALRASEEAGGMVRAHAAPVGSYTDMVQYAGVWADADGYAREYAEKYIHMLLSDKEQKKLSAVGALPVAPVTEPMYEQDALMRSLLQTPVFPQAFGWGEAVDGVKPLAPLALSGDEAARKTIEDALALVILGK